MSERLHTKTVVSGHAPDRLELDDAELRVVGGADKGLHVALGRDSLCIGSDADCDLVLTDKTVSARHAQVVVTTESGYQIRDLGSRNGMYLGAWQIERAPLAHGMKLRLGQ